VEVLGILGAAGMVFVWGAGNERGKQGFDRSLLPRIRKAQAGNKKGNGKDAVSGSNT
jgi:hypothetical protein